MIKFIHTADIHLDSPLKGLETYEDAPVEEIRRATRRAFDNLIDLAIDEEVDFILIAGDLYDGDWKDYNTGLFFAARMGRLSKARIRVFIVSGNHDAASQITKAMPLPDNVTLFSFRKPQSVKLDDLDVVIHGQSYSSRAVTENLASQYPQFDSNYFNIGLLHTSLTGREGHENYVPCTLDDLTSKGYDYWALGHIHKREVISKDPMILFPGNIQGRHIKETGAKGATLVTVEDGRITEVKEPELDVLRWSICHVDLSECETKETVYEKVRSAMEKEQGLTDGKTLALRLQLEGSCLLHAELHARSTQMTEEIRGIAASLGDIWLEKVNFRTNRKTSMEEIVGENTPLSGLMQAIESLDFGEDALTTLVPDLANLRTKLPAELLDEDSLTESQPENLSELQEEVKEFLIAKLIQHGGEA
ncbi:MAG: DNA repair exonuclease [Planctomycetes bacterium]|nr:DNA repair exonuclease [Planctomycetota bacterium]